MSETLTTTSNLKYNLEDCSAPHRKEGTKSLAKTMGQRNKESVDLICKVPQHASNSYHSVPRGVIRSDY